MLKRLYIRNFTLIDELDMEFGGGFSVITGETGAGKSIILGALGLLLGQRADIKSIKSGADRCIIEAHFDLSRYDLENFFEAKDLDYDAGDCILRREVTISGKSRAFINDTPVALATMRELGSQLVDIHSQHQNLLLHQEDFQLSVIDIIAHDDSDIADYRASYQALVSVRKNLEQLRETIRRDSENEDYLRFQLNELETARLVEGEQEELEQEYDMLSHAEEIKEALFGTDELLSGEQGTVQQLKNASHNLESVKDVFPAIAEAAERLESSLIEIKDIADEVARQSERVDFNPARMEEVNSRLDHLYHLQQKHHTDSVANLIALRDDLSRQLSQIEGGDEQLQELEAQEQALTKTFDAKADRLTKVRTN